MTDYTSIYYGRDGRSVTQEEWSDLFSNTDDRRVGAEYVRDLNGRRHFVSTVWIGLDHSFGNGERPLIFETMIFCHGHECVLDNAQWRWTNEQEAEKGHVISVELVESTSTPFLDRAKGNIITYLQWLRLRGRNLRNRLLLRSEVGK